MKKLIMTILKGIGVVLLGFFGIVFFIAGLGSIFNGNSDSVIMGIFLGLLFLVFAFLCVLGICKIVGVEFKGAFKSLNFKRTNQLEKELHDTQLQKNNLELELNEVKQENDTLKKLEYMDVVELDKYKTKLEDEVSQLKIEKDSSNKELKIISEKIIEQEEIVELETFGLYTPKFDFISSEYYADKLREIRNSQKELIKNNKAMKMNLEITFNGNLKEGQKMVKDTAKLFLRAFNSECEICMGKVTFSNVEKMVERINKTFDQINKQGVGMGVGVEVAYLELKIQELYLAYEYQVKKQEEKEEQREIKEQMREEAKAQKELENLRREIEKENMHYTNAYNKVLSQLESAKDDIEREIILEKVNELKSKIDEIEEKIKEVDFREANKRAGYVYVISNIGSFGENVFKIGMTRRLEPLDRVNELGDASVPFRFDVHAMIFSDDAPSLENALHKKFSDNKVNMINARREFFNVTLMEIEQAVKENFDKSVEFTKFAIAEEYRESLKIKESLKN